MDRKRATVFRRTLTGSSALASSRYAVVASALFFLPHLAPSSVTALHFSALAQVDEDDRNDREDADEDWSDDFDGDDFDGDDFDGGDRDFGDEGGDFEDEAGEDGDDGEDADDEDDDNDDDTDDDDSDDYDDEDERDFSEAVGIEPDDFEFDDEGFPARSSEILAFDLNADELAIARDLGFEVIERRELRSLGGSIDRLRVPPQYSLPGAVDALEGALLAAPFDYNHIYILPEGAESTEAGPPTPIGQPRAGRGIRIGVIDTVVDTAHPSLRGQSVAVRDFAEGGQRDRIHGTSVVSILVGSDPSSGYSGLLPGAEVFAANVFSVDQEGMPSTNTLAMIEALDWLVGQDVDVINISIAGPDSAVFAEAISRVQNRGKVVVAAVGNDGPAAPPLFPASYDGVIGVTAIDLNRRVFRRAGRGDQVDFSAPGVRVRAATDQGSYSIMSGTSFATPVVAALIALRLAERSPDLSDELLALSQSALDLGQPGKDQVFGYGLLILEGER